jgi:hypothetical protein
MALARLLSLATIGAALFFLSHSGIRADPPADNCSTRCWDRQYFISDPFLVCFQYINNPDCSLCGTNALKNANRCVDFVGPTQPKCTPALDANKQQIKVLCLSHLKGSCERICNLPANLYAEATQPASEDPLPLILPWFVCGN